MANQPIPEPRSLLTRLARLFLSNQLSLLDTLKRLPADQQRTIAEWIAAAEEAETR